MAKKKKKRARKTPVIKPSKTSRKPWKTKAQRPVIKQSSPELSTLAAEVMAGRYATQEDAKRLAASVLAQDETRGQQ